MSDHRRYRLKADGNVYTIVTQARSISGPVTLRPVISPAGFGGLDIKTTNDRLAVDFDFFDARSQITTSDHDAIIGAGLRAIRERLGASDYELAACIGSAAQVNARETGTVTLDRDTLREHLAALVLLASRPR